MERKKSTFISHERLFENVLFTGLCSMCCLGYLMLKKSNTDKERKLDVPKWSILHAWSELEAAFLGVF